MMKSALAFLFLTGSSLFAFSQSPCNIQGFANPAQIACGDSLVLSAFGNGSGNVAFQENFNSGSPVGWQFTQTVTIANNTCGVPSPDGSPFMWMGAASVNPRDMTTVPFNLTLGGTICFEMRYAVQGDPSPCEGPDEPGEGVYVQYSTNGGANWTTIQYWNPNGGYDPQLTNWNQYCVVIPPGAQTPNTMIRWHQDAVSGAVYDHWGIDNVLITLNDPSYVISWQHDGYSYGFGSSGGVNPHRVSPTANTTYTVQITDGTHTCTDQVAVVVTNPVIVMHAGPDTTICPGECVHIDANAYWEVKAPGPMTFVNDISQTISAGFGGGAIQIPVSVGGLNLSTVQPGSILEVCITNMSYFGQNIFPPSTLTVGSFAINLSCPGGTSIQLVPAGVTTSTFILPGYVHTCFNMTTANNIAASAPPYTNTFAPAQPFNNLVGCQANGIWNMSLVPNGGLGIGTGNFAGWSITFDDPGLTAPVSYSWSPTTNMTGSNTLTPNVCPTQTTTYTLTATTAPGCQSATADVTVTVPNSCCQLQLVNTVTQNPSCTTPDGQIQITTSGEIAGLRFSINNGTTYQTSNTFTGLAAGTYQIVINDNNNCPVYGTVTLTNPNAPVIGNIAVTPSSCTGNNGSITITASAGTPSYTYSINGGTAFQAGNGFTGLAAGTYAIVVKDAAGCTASGSAQITQPTPPTITSTDFTPADCGTSNGSATVHATGGTGSYTYSWSPSGGNGATTGGISSGSYTVTVTDSLNCTATSSVTVPNIGGPDITIVTQTDVTCSGQTNGSIHVQVTQGGTPPYIYSWFPSGGNSSTATGLAAGNYIVTVTDADQCIGALAVTINEPPALTVSVGTQATECGKNEGEAAAGAGGGTPPYTYAWSPGGGTGSALTALAGGNYTVTVTDAAGCLSTASAGVDVVVTDSLLAFTVAATPESCASNDGSATVTVTGGVAPYTYQWNAGSGSTTATVQGLPAGTYTLTVTDQCYSKSVPVTIEKSFKKPDSKIPNVFTPNTDGTNDIYTVNDNFSDTQNFSCVIYNRWGNTVYKTEHKEINWVAKNISDGVYFIVITYTDCLGENEKIASTITIAGSK